MITCKHTLVVNCDTLPEYTLVLAQLQAGLNAQNSAPPIQALHPVLGQKRINVIFVPYHHEW